MKKIILSIVILAAVASSCKKDKEDVPIVYAEENFYSAFLVQTGFSEKERNFNGLIDSEMGFTFKSSVKGSINSLIIKMPFQNSNMRVTIWDATTREVLLTNNITTLVNNTENIIPISPFIIEKDKLYFIFFNSKHCIIRTKTNGSNVTYPFKIGNISIVSVNFKDTRTQSYPTEILTNRYFGDLSFNFQQTP
jgi:hypothetical protein